MSVFGPGGSRRGQPTCHHAEFIAPEDTYSAHTHLPISDRVAEPGRSGCGVDVARFGMPSLRSRYNQAHLGQGSNTPPTASSASCTAASRPTPPTTNTSPGRTSSTPLLDTLEPGMSAAIRSLRLQRTVVRSQSPRHRPRVAAARRTRSAELVADGTDFNFAAVQLPSSHSPGFSTQLPVPPPSSPPPPRPPFAPAVLAPAFAPAVLAPAFAPAVLAPAFAPAFALAFALAVLALAVLALAVLALAFLALAFLALAFLALAPRPRPRPRPRSRRARSRSRRARSRSRRVRSRSRRVRPRSALAPPAPIRRRRSSRTPR